MGGAYLIIIKNSGAKVEMNYPTPSRAETEAMVLMTRNVRDIREIRVQTATKVLAKWRAYTAWKKVAQR